MDSKAGKTLTRFLAAVVILLIILDGGLTVSSPWWLEAINQISYKDLSGIVYGMFEGARSDAGYPIYTAFTIICGVLCMGILVSALRILRRILKDEPFCHGNVVSFKVAAVFAFCLTLVFLIKMSFSASILTLVCAGAFLLFGLFMMVLASLFSTAARIKEENELTI